jgi:7-keto-8-aminopelargonate synthetase-like enzyme
MTKLPVSAASPTSVTIGGREVLSFGGCNYLGLAHHPVVHAAMLRGLQQYGLSTSASRETTGNTIAHDRLEQELAAFLGTPDGVVVPDGYTANLAIAETLAKDSPRCSVAVIDERSHRSIREAAIGAGMQLVAYKHLNSEDAAGKIALNDAAGANVAVFTDGVFTSDGTIAPVRDLLAALPKRAMLVVDDCHGFGVMGPRGQGTLSAVDLMPTDPRLVITTTLAKGLGCHGGVIAGSRDICSRVRARGSAYICTTPTSPAVACAASAALEILRAEPQRVARLQANAAHLRRSLVSLGIALAETPAPIAAFVLRDESEMRRLHTELLDAGILAPLISYPGGPAACYFRLSIGSEHTFAHVDRLIEAMAARLAGVRAA